MSLAYAVLAFGVLITYILLSTSGHVVSGSTGKELAIFDIYAGTGTYSFFLSFLIVPKLSVSLRMTLIFSFQYPGEEGFCCDQGLPLRRRYVRSHHSECCLLVIL